MSLLSKEVERIKQELTNKEVEELVKELQYKDWSMILKPIEQSYEYYKGFYDATRQFIQTFEKLIEVGAFSGTKTNSNN